jgi:hypothetical protein
MVTFIFCKVLGMKYKKNLLENIQEKDIPVEFGGLAHRRSEFGGSVV